MKEDTLDTLFAQGQIRLSEISVFNWGSFHQLHTARIDPEGTLITGDNGAGKSTFIDGLMALLQPAGKASFNVAAAQGDRSDRSLLSYMRGSFGSEHDGSSTKTKSKRDKAVTTALRALYTAEDGSKMTLVGLFWLAQGKNALSDVNRLYMVASRDVQLTEVLEQFADGNTRQLKQHFNPKHDSRILYFEQDFATYQATYRDVLFMDNPNAPALLSRALGLKKIDDLTKLIRELVLESSHLRESAQTAVLEFADLKSVYEHLRDTREQVEHLQRLPQCALDIEQDTQTLSQLSLEKQALPAYFGELFAAHWTAQAQHISEQLDAIEQDFQSILEQEQLAEEQQERCHESYLQLGGNQIENLRKELSHIQDNLNRVVLEASKYQQDAKQLNLPDELGEAALKQNQSVVQLKLEHIESEKAQLEDELVEAGALYSQLQRQLRDLAQDIEEIEARPNSNIHDVHLLRLREELQRHLSLDEHELMFVGELLDVKDSEKPWQGAIERALGGLKTTLLVPEAYYSMVTKWVNARHHHTHVRLQVVRLQHKHSAQFKADGFLNKLLWREHAYRDWLKQHLQRFDLHCLSDTEQLNQTPYAMTLQGLIQFELGRFEKKDQSRVDDRKAWCLGFSNTARLQLLKQELQVLQQQQPQAQSKLQEARLQLDQFNAHKAIFERLLRYTWDQIAVPLWQQRQALTEQDLQRLQQADSDAEQARQRWDAAKHALKEIHHQKEQLKQQQGQLQQQQRDTLAKQQRARQAANQGVDDAARVLLEQRIGQIEQLNEALQTQFEGQIQQLIEQKQQHKNSLQNLANGIMVSFRSKDKWAHIPLQRDWPIGLVALNDYVDYLLELQRDGLPQLVEQFQNRLHKHTTQSLSVIHHKLNANRDEIVDRIYRINVVLKRTEFKQGSYLRLGFKKEKYPHVIDFEQRLKQVVSEVNHADYELRFKQLDALMAILDKASSAGTASSLESLRLLDPRYQMSFHAEEIDNITGDIRDVLESSSGKSGGEKESFAGTIVAASLAYVLTPDGYDYPIYSTIFLDEAFSNTAEAVSRRVLKVFKALKLHVNLITPYKNLNLARESARSLLIAERDIDAHESHLCEVTWQEIDERLQARQQQITQQAEQFGIELNG